MTLIPLTRSKQMTQEQLNRMQELVQVMFGKAEPIEINQQPSVVYSQ
jgi:hypothetical protein